MAIIVDTGSKGSIIDYDMTAANAYTPARTVADNYAQTVRLNTDTLNRTLSSLNAPSGSGGGGGGGGGGGIDYTDPNAGSRVRDDLIFWFGINWVNSNLSAVSYHLERQSTVDDIRRYAVDNGANGPGMQQVKAVLLQSMGGLLGSTVVGSLPDSVIRTLIYNEAYRDAATLETSVVGLKGINWKQALDPATGSPTLAPFFDLWEEMTSGANFGPTAASQLQKIIQQYGYGTEGYAAWNRYVPTTFSAKSGNYGDTRRQEIRNTLEPLIGRALTDQELSTDGALWDMSPASLYEYAQTTTEYKTRFAGKPIGMSENEFLGTKAAWDWVYRQAYGEDVAGASPMVKETVFASDQDAGLAKARELGYSSLAEWKADVGTTAYNAAVSQYIQTDGKPVLATSPGQTLSNVPPALMQWAFENNVSPDQWYQSLQWEQQAILAEGTYEPTLLRTMGVDLSEDDWYKFTSKAIGWANIQMQINEAQNREQFRQVVLDYTGREPTTEEYAAVTADFVSPAHYAKRMAAKEEAIAQAPQINELLQRVMGTSVSQSDLEKMVMGGEGSGALKAQIDQAMRLDQYRLTLKTATGTEPTPDDYARYAGYAGNAELQWELNTIEKMAEFGPDIKELLPGMSDEQLKIMLGDMTGSGELKYQYKKAQEVQSDKEQADLHTFSAERASTYMQKASQGGIATSLTGLDNL